MTKLRVAETNKRVWRSKQQLLYQVLSLVLVCSTALNAWKALVLYTQSESPVVVLLSGSMEPGIHRGDLLFLDNRKRHLDVGDIVVFKVEGREIPIAHRVIKRQSNAKDGTELYLTKGDENGVDDRGLYTDGQKWLQRDDIVGIAQVYVPYVGLLTLMLNNYPLLKCLVFGAIGLHVTTKRQITKPMWVILKLFAITAFLSIAQNTPMKK